MAYSLIPIVAFLLAAIINWDVFLDKNYPVMDRRIFRAYKVLIICNCVFFIADSLWGVFNDLPNKIPSIIDTTIFFVAMSFGVTAWLRFASKYLEEGKTITRAVVGIGYAFFLSGVVLVTINLFHPILFAYEEGVYVPKAGRYGYFTAQMVMYLTTSVFALLRINKNVSYKRGRFLTIALIGLVMSISIFLQIIFEALPLYSFGHLICLILLHMFIVTSEKADYRKHISEASAREEQKTLELEATRELAYQDPLTGVRNKHAYVEKEEEIDLLLRDRSITELCLFIFDLNDLKKINDTYGHEKGDEYIIKSVQIIKNVFKNQIIYRIGGDEFATFVEGEDYKRRYRLLEKFNVIVESNIGKKEPIIAIGFSDYVPEEDNSLRSVFTRADERMYSRKRKLKEMTGENYEEVKNEPTASDSMSRLDVYEMFYNNDKRSLIKLLNNSSCDEIVEVDTVNDTFKQFYHVEGKYFVPNVEFSYKDLVNFTVEHIVHPNDVGTYLALMKIDGFFERLASSKIPNFNFAHFRYKLQDGSYRYVEQCVIAGEENGIPPGMFRMYVFDIHNLMTRRIGIISDESNVISVGRDQVTGLLTSKAFFSAAEKIVKDNKDKQWCILLMDIEHFKFFDEWFGREQGNYLLAKIGAELAESEKKMGGVAGYFGQDDYAVLAEYNEANIESIYERIKALISSFNLTTGFLPAIGVSLLEKDMILMDAFDRASIAVDKAKGDVHHRIIYYNSDMQFHAENEYRILTEFVYALKNDEITFYLQPQVNAKTEKIVGVEALVRWIKKDGKVVSPAEFIPVLEKYNFITDMDQYVWDKVFASLKEWLDMGYKAVPCSINVSRLDIYNFDIAEFIHELAEKYAVPHHLIKVEITESSYAESMEVVDELVKKLRADGFSVMMDDFGRGYSSLNMLSTIKLDAIKLDSNFLHLEGADYERGVRVIESVVNMAKTIGLPIIVEGVETKQQCEFLSELGCRYIQGYYFYRPLPVEEFRSVLLDQSKIDHQGFVVKANEQLRIREFLDKNIYSDSMLNNIIGAVAFYSWNGDHVDIVRFNQQFYQSVNVPDFVERLVNIENFVPEEERPSLFAALKEAKNNRLSGSTVLLHFIRSDGTYMCFRMRFYYLDKKEGGELFYGSAINVTESADLLEIKELVAQYSLDNLLFINWVNEKMRFTVVSHGLSDIFGITPKELENELNSDLFANRVVNIKQLDELDKKVAKNSGKNADFESALEVYDKDHNKLKLKLVFTCVRNITYNINYILKCEVVK